MKRILYVESAPQVGGSTVSLFELVCRMDRSTYQPIVLMCASNPYTTRFADVGVPVVTTGDYCSVRTPAYPPGLAQARRSSLAALMRRHRLTRTFLHGVGLLTRTVCQTWPLARSVRGIIRRERINLVHLNDAPELHKAGILACKLAAVPCICHVRSMPPLDALDRLLARFVAHFIFISQAVERDQRGKGLGNRPGSVIYNALDLSAYKALDRRAARARFGLADDDMVVGMMARIEPWKGQRGLLAALGLLKARFPRLRCLIAGAPELDGQWYADELVSTVTSLGLERVVTFVGYQRDAPRFMAALDVLVHASVQPEPFGRALIEGMAAGLPVVATNAGGVPEIVLDGETGLLVPPGDPPALAAAISRLLADPAWAAGLGRRGRQRAESFFAIEKHVAAVQAVYAELLSL